MTKLPPATRISRVGHGRVGQPHRQQRLDLHPQLAARLLHAGQGSLVGDAGAAHIAGARAASGELGVDLRARAMHQHQPHAQRGQQIQVVSERDELAIGHHLAAECHHEGPAAERVDVRRRGAEPVDEAFGWSVIGNR